MNNPNKKHDDKQTETKEETHIEPPAPEAASAPPATVEESATGTALAAYDFGDDAGSGMENVTRDEYKIPFIRVLQQMSPQCAPPINGGVEGAKPGMFFNTATGEIHDALIVVPTSRDHNFVKYNRRKEDGGNNEGFIQIYAPDDPIILMLREKQGKFGKLLPGDTPPTEIAETMYLYSLVAPATKEGKALGTFFRCILAFTSTQIPKYQTFVSRYMGIQYEVRPNEFVRPPLWAHKWFFTTVYETKKKGSIYGYRITLFGRNEDNTESKEKSLIKRTDPLYLDGKAFYESIKKGDVKADYSQAGAGQDEPGASEPNNGSGAANPDDDVPF